MPTRLEMRGRVDLNATTENGLDQSLRRIGCFEFTDARVQVVHESGTAADTAVVTLQASLDGEHWSDLSGATVTGVTNGAALSASSIDITGIPFVRPMVTTGQGAAATGRIVVYLENASV